MSQHNYRHWPRDAAGRLIIHNAQDMRELSRIVSADATARRDIKRQLTNLDNQRRRARKSPLVTAAWKINLSTRALVLREILAPAAKTAQS